MQCQSLWIKASAKCINVNVKREHNTGYASPANHRQTMEFKSRSDISDSVLLCCLGPHKLITLESGLFPVPNVACSKAPMGLGDCAQNEDQTEEIQDKYNSTATGTNVQLMLPGAINRMNCSALFYI